MKHLIGLVVTALIFVLLAGSVGGPSRVASRIWEVVESSLGVRRRHWSIWMLIPLSFVFLIMLGCFAAQGQTACVQPPAGATAWWSFDEPSGNIAADRLVQSPGAWTNGPMSGPGEVRGALSFNGGSYLTVQDSSLWNFGANDFTIELWANFSAPPGGSVGEPAAILIGNDEGPGDRNKWFFAVGGGNLYFHINSPTLGPQFFPLVQFSPTVGQWYHLAIVRAGSTYTVFINGIASGSATNAKLIPDPNAPLTMGQAESIGFMHGSLDEVTVYSRALAPEEIQAIYNSGSSGKCINLRVSPNTGGDTGNVSMNINGVGFQQGATVNLAMNGQTSIAGTPVTVGASGTSITTTFNLAGRADGAWDVVVTNPNGTSFTLPQGFSIQPGTGAHVWVDVVGIGLIVPGRAQTFQIFYGNSGNVDAVGVPLWIAGIPADATLNLGFNVLPPLALDTSVGYSQVPTYFNFGTDLEGAFVVPVIRAGSTGALQISVTVPSLENFKLQAWANPPWFGPSVPTTSTSSQFVLGPSMSDRMLLQSLASSAQSSESSSTSDILGCSVGVLDALNGGLSLTNPQAACVASLNQVYETTLTTEGTIFTGEQPGWSNVFNLVWALGQEAYQCTTALACTACQTPGVGEALPESCVACTALNIGQIANIAVGAYQTSAACTTVALQTGAALGALAVIAIDSFDPNNKVGPQGFGTSQFLSGKQPLHYSVSVENDPTATAPVQHMVITDQLDPTKVDLTTLSLGPISFGANQAIPPANSTTFATILSLQPTQNLNVQITASLDPNTGLLTWIFSAIDPTTGNPPTDPAVGFLPPDVNPPQGDGSVLFTVMPKQGLATGTQITNQATIVFDANAPIPTPTWLNTLDVTPPVSTVSALPSTEVAGSGGLAKFSVSWSGTDDGSGISTYTIYVSDNSGPFTAWQTSTTQTTAAFTGTTGNTYSFYSIAADNVGNVEAVKTMPEADTQVTTATPVNPTVIWPTASAITYGQTLASSMLSGGSAVSSVTNATVAGSFIFSTSTSAPSAGSQPENVIFTPDDPTDYAQVTGTVNVFVNQATPTLTWPTASAITYGQTLASSILSGGLASVSGTFAFTNPAIVPTITSPQGVTFTPATIAGVADYMTVTGSVTVTVTAAPLASISTTTLNFGTIYLGSIGTKTVSLSNIGDAAMTITDPLISIVNGGDSEEFIAVNLCPKSLAAGKSCTIGITFIAGPIYNPQTAVLRIIDSASGSPQSVMLSATVIDPQASLNLGSLSFGNQTVNQGVTKTLVLRNTGATTLQNIAVSVTGKNAAQFALTPSSNCGSSLTAGSSCMISVTFRPLAKVSYTAALQINDNAQSGAKTVPLSGTGQ